MIKILLFPILAAFCAQNLDNCSTRDTCSSKPLTLESVLPAQSAKQEVINEKAPNKKEPTAYLDIDNLPQPAKQSNNGNVKRTFENPQYLLVWIVIFAGLYFYFRDKKRKGKK